MDELILPGGRRRKAVRVLEHAPGAPAAAIDVHESGTVYVETPTEQLMLEPGNWMIVQAEEWHAILRALLEARQMDAQARALIEASTREGRRARKIVEQHKRDRRN